MTASPEESIALAVLAVYALVLVAAVVLHKRRTCRNWSLYLLYIVNRIYIALGFHWRSNHRCPYPTDSAAIIYANHKSPVDPMFLWMNSHTEGQPRRTRPILFLTAKEYSEVGGIISWICHTMETIPVDRTSDDPRPIRAALRKLREGELLGIFPEGGINLQEGIGEGTPGLAWLALSTGVPVYPTYIQNAPGGDSMIEPFYNFRRVRVHYGTPVDLSPYEGKKKTPELLEEVTVFLMDHLRKLAREAKPLPNG